MIIVAKDGSGQFDSIQEAIDSIQMLPETIHIKEGIYHERVEIRCPFLTLEGEGSDKTIIEHNYYAMMPYTEQEKRGTFRSYTMLIIADHFTAKNLTVANTAGSGKEISQAIAVYNEGDFNQFLDCRILGHQDTLFTGPLPLEPARPGGFTGPTEFAKRVAGHQLYQNCYIEGDVDFIFGSAFAYFDHCTIHSTDRDGDVKGYVTAASTYKDNEYGYVFHQCRFTGDCPPKSVYLGRPWRIYAKTVLIECELGAHIKEEGFFDWGKPESHETVLYAEYNCSGPGYTPNLRADYVKQLSKEEAQKYTRKNVIGF